MSFAVTVADADLEPDEVDPDSVLDGDPQTASLVLHADEKVERGIWEITPGTYTDVEADEIFVVLSGRATVKIEGEEALEIGPGDVGVFDKGAETTWVVHETLRKVYQITL
jgi:uncharacterized cupin superfamily protein